MHPRPSQLPDALLRLIGELGNVSAEGRASYIETLVAFSRFAKSCDLPPASLRLYELAVWLKDLDEGRVAPTLTPTNTGKGTAPDSAIMWNERVLVLVAFAMLQKAEMGQQESVRYIARKYPVLRSLMNRGKNLANTILRWRRNLYDARPGDFLHSFGTNLVEHEDFLKAQQLTPEQWKISANNMLARLSERVSP